MCKFGSGTLDSTNIPPTAIFLLRMGNAGLVRRFRNSFAKLSTTSGSERTNSISTISTNDREDSPTSDLVPSPVRRRSTLSLLSSALSFKSKADVKGVGLAELTSVELLEAISGMRRAAQPPERRHPAILELRA